MSDLHDVQMHGAGNRFLLHFGSTPPARLLRHLEGADGLLIIQQDEQSDAQMRIFNADGSEAEQCGNGLRCVALHLVRSNCIKNDRVVIRTQAGLHTCIVHEERNEVTVSLCKPKVGSACCNVDTSKLGDLPELIFVDMGNPNAVLLTEDDPVDIRQQWGAFIVQHPAFRDGMNLHVARRDGVQYASCASWERGVGATLASGTGGGAVFVASSQHNDVDSVDAAPLFYVSSLGGTLTFRYDDTGVVVMTGPAGYV